WGLPAVAGVVLEAPPGCGGPELTAKATAAAGAHLHTVSLDLVFKPNRLLDLLEQAVKQTPRPCVIHIDRVEAVAGGESMAPFKSQVAAIFRWFLDAVSEEAGLAAVIGTTSVGAVDSSLTDSALLPRVLSIPPPDGRRRALLFESALGRVPTTEIDHELLASRSPGFSGADILAAVIHASARGIGVGPLTTEDLVEAVGETRPSLGSISLGEIPSYGFEKVANLVDVKQRLTEAVIWPMTRPEGFARLGIDPPKGMLLYGPPGTGKTFVIRALAHEAGAAFFPVKGAEMLDKYVGESERAVRDTFSRARAAAPAILFFDELDALAPVRGSSTNSVTDSVVAALLTELDGIGSRGQIFVIGATNRRDLIDPALLRSGRFEVHLELGLPEVEARRALLDIVDIPFDETVDLDELAARTDGLSFADLTGLLREAALQALRTDAHAMDVGMDELDRALERFR
ncbi:MAG: ATP-binding protein, partial [Acidimicrobiia bacterium]